MLLICQGFLLSKKRTLRDSLRFLHYEFFRLRTFFVILLFFLGYCSHSFWCSPWCAIYRAFIYYNFTHRFLNVKSIIFVLFLLLLVILYVICHFLPHIWHFSSLLLHYFLKVHKTSCIYF